MNPERLVERGDLDAIYTQAEWKQHGFTYKQFLKWGTIDLDFRVILVGDLTVSVPMSRFPKPGSDLFKDILLPDQSEDQSYYLVNPEWAARWKGIVNDSLSAARWQSFGFSPEHAALIKKLGYIKPKTAHGPYNALLKNGVFDYMKRHDLFTFRGVKGAFFDGEQDEGFIDLCLFIIDPQYQFSDGQKEAIMTYLAPKPSYYRRTYGGGSTEINFGFNRQVKERITALATTLDVIQGRGWSIPDGDGTFSTLTDCLTRTNSYHHSFIKVILDHISDFDSFYDMLVKMEEMTQRDQYFLSSHHGNYQLLYSHLSGIPFDWITGDVLANFMSGNDEIAPVGIAQPVERTPVSVIRERVYEAISKDEESLRT